MMTLDSQGKISMEPLLKEQEDIESWLQKYRIRNYTLVPDEIYDYVVNVDGNVWLGERNLSQLMVKFNIVQGNFDCSKNQLITLLGSPEQAKSFNCSHNKLKSLQYCPKISLGSFDCNDNDLETIEYGPEKLNLVMNIGFNAHNNPKIGHWQKANFKDWKAYQQKLKTIVDFSHSLEYELSEKNDVYPKVKV